MSGKRKRVVLTIKDKLDIIKKLEDGGSSKQLAGMYGIGETTVRDIRKNKEKIITYASSSDSTSLLAKRKSMKPSMYEELDRAMLEWFNQQRARGNPVSGPLCAKRAEFFFYALGMDGDFNPSAGWLTRFKQRHSIREMSARGERPRGDGERVTVLCCANASGLHKLKPCVVGRARKPRSFQAADTANLPVSYFSQKGAWMDLSIFRHWFDKIFVPQVREHLRAKGLPERAVLLLDNSPTHPNENVLRSDDGQIFARCLPPHVAPSVQPSGQGVLAALKRNYRAGLLQTNLDEGDDLKSFWKELTLLDALYEVAAAWGRVQPATISRAWKRILPALEDRDGLDVPEEETSVAAVASLLRHTRGLEHVTADHLEKWLEVDSTEPGYEAVFAGRFGAGPRASGLVQAGMRTGSRGKRRGAVQKLCAEMLLITTAAMRLRAVMPSVRSDRTVALSGPAGGAVRAEKARGTRLLKRLLKPVKGLEVGTGSWNCDADMNPKDGGAGSPWDDRGRGPAGGGCRPLWSRAPGGLLEVGSRTPLEEPPERPVTRGCPRGWTSREPCRCACGHSPPWTSRRGGNLSTGSDVAAGAHGTGLGPARLSTGWARRRQRTQAGQRRTPLQRPQVRHKSHGQVSVTGAGLQPRGVRSPWGPPDRGQLGEAPRAPQIRPSVDGAEPPQLRFTRAALRPVLSVFCVVTLL
ncbi:PREDICTED: jerky protein homolog-like [Condylura cristata]|uniref:jerky protein homolog-like n=1 Tax=Condylura cristata TaxID=143302 RepID=UPI000643BD7A|nr:PREDICTED: jerky protein homolog-like [Condylura cristata]